MSPLQAYVRHCALGGDRFTFARERGIPLNVSARIEAACVRLGWIQLTPKPTRLGYRKAGET